MRKVFIYSVAVLLFAFVVLLREQRLAWLETEVRHQNEQLDGLYGRMEFLLDVDLCAEGVHVASRSNVPGESRWVTFKELKRDYVGGLILKR